jgi:hypothetical protein
MSKFDRDGYDKQGYDKFGMNRKRRRRGELGTDNTSAASKKGHEAWIERIRAAKATDGREETRKEVAKVVFGPFALIRGIWRACKSALSGGENHQS